MKPVAETIGKLLRDHIRDYGLVLEFKPDLGCEGPASGL